LAAISRFLVAATRTLIVEQCRETGFVLDESEALGDASLEIRLDRLRRHVHREIDLDLIGDVRGGACCRFRYKGALPYPGIEQTAPPRFAIGARHCRQINAESPRQSAMGRKLLAAGQTTACDIRLKRSDDALVNRTRPLRNCRDPTHAL
jgi:hypothetical protein